MEVKYTLELEDYVALNRHLQDQENQKNGFSFSAAVASSGIGSLVCAGLAAYQGFGGNTTRAFAFGAAAMGLAFMFLNLLRNHYSSLKALRRRLSEETRDKVGKEHILRVGPAGIVDSQDGDISIPWSSISDIASSRGCVYLFTETAVWIVPGRCLAGENGLAEFERTVRQHWQQHRGTWKVGNSVEGEG